jgi:DNA repair exonuclease SbcCD nuclease subunit
VPMRFTFIHTADWQLGKRFGGFDERLAGRLEEARLDAIDRVAEVADAHGARHVLVAGDVYDAPDLKERTLRQPLTRMGQHRGITWVLMPGNHDPAGGGSVWSRLRRIGVPDNIIIADRAEPIEIEPGVLLLPAPLMSKATRRDPTAWFDGLETGAHVMRIGMAHGSVQGFGSEGESQIPIDPARVERARLDYLVLGDWHGTKRITQRCWYSGTPEPDNFANNPKGQVLVVTLGPEVGPQGLASVQVDEVATGLYAWAQISRQVLSEADLAVLNREIEALFAPQSRLLVKLRLSGALPLAGHAVLERFKADLDSRLQHLDCRDDMVALTGDIDAGEIEAVAGMDGELREIISRLAALAQREELSEQDAAGMRGAGAAGRDDAAVAPAVARTALLRLLAFARAAGEGA